MLEGRVALITGSTRGIGGVIARLFADHGASVGLHGRDAAALADVRAQIEWIGARAVHVAAELTRYDEVEAMCERVEDELGPIDVLVAGAGVGPPRPGLSHEDDWFEPADAGLTATFYTIKAVLRRMTARRNGAIVVISSAAPRAPGLMSSVAHAAGAAGIQALTLDIAMQAAPFDVRVNCIVPHVGLGARETPPPRDTRRRSGLANEVADAALYLASEASAWAWVTGAVVDVDVATRDRVSAAETPAGRFERKGRAYAPVRAGSVLQSRWRSGF